MGEMAQRIVKQNKDEIIKELQIAFAEEWLAYYQYWIGAQVAVGPQRTSITAEFTEHAGEELKHAQWLSDRLIQLGSLPILDPQEWQQIAQCRYAAPTKPYVVNLIEQNVVAERCAIARYQKICELTFGKDFETFRLAEKILKEEIEHEQEIGDFGDDIRASSKYGDQEQES